MLRWKRSTRTKISGWWLPGLAKTSFTALLRNHLIEPLLEYVCAVSQYYTVDDLSGACLHLR